MRPGLRPRPRRGDPRVRRGEAAAGRPGRGDPRVRRGEAAAGRPGRGDPRVRRGEAAAGRPGRGDPRVRRGEAAAGRPGRGDTGVRRGEAAAGRPGRGDTGVRRGEAAAGRPGRGDTGVRRGEAAAGRGESRLPGPRVPPGRVILRVPTSSATASTSLLPITRLRLREGLPEVARDLPFASAPSVQSRATRIVSTTSDRNNFIPIKKPFQFLYILLDSVLGKGCARTLL